jgi:hypothetical protein
MKVLRRCVMSEMAVSGDSENTPETGLAAPSSDALARRLVHLERQRGAVVRQLRNETAQVLSYAILELAAAQGRAESIETELQSLQEALRIELYRLLGIVGELTAPLP